MTLIVFESFQFLTPRDMVQLERSVPRRRRVIIDPDGKYSVPSSAGRDTNHPTGDSYSFWTGLYNRLSDLVLQPCIELPTPPIRSFLYFGVDKNRPASSTSYDKAAKTYDLIYVGNNWYRWEDIVWLIRSLEPIRARLGRIAVFGKWWDGNSYAEFPWQTYSDPSFLISHGVECHGSVPFGMVESTMSRGYLNPVLTRPILNNLRLATPRMFETFNSSTVPLVPPYMSHCQILYGPSVEDLCLPQDPSAKIVEMLDNYPRYFELAREIATALAVKHSYEHRITELLELLP